MKKLAALPLSAILFLVQLVVFLAGLYFVAVLAFHGILVFAIPLFLAWLGLLVLLGLGRRAAKAWRHGGIVPKIEERVSRRNTTIVFLVLLFAAARATASDYPEIKVLSADDPLFVQHQSELEDYYRIARAREPGVLPSLSIFQYKLRKGEDLFSLNARWAPL